jgi:hypothetical protein
VKKYDFRGIPTRALEKEVEHRASLAYARRVHREYKAIAEHKAKLMSKS